MYRAELLSTETFTRLPFMLDHKWQLPFVITLFHVTKIFLVQCVVIFVSNLLVEFVLIPMHLLYNYNNCARVTECGLLRLVLRQLYDVR